MSGIDATLQVTARHGEVDHVVGTKWSAPSEPIIPQIRGMCTSQSEYVRCRACLDQPSGHYAAIRPPRSERRMGPARRSPTCTHLADCGRQHHSMMLGSDQMPACSREGQLPGEDPRPTCDRTGSLRQQLRRSLLAFHPRRLDRGRAIYLKTTGSKRRDAARGGSAPRERSQAMTP